LPDARSLSAAKALRNAIERGSSTSARLQCVSQGWGQTLPIEAGIEILSLMILTLQCFSMTFIISSSKTFPLPSCLALTKEQSKTSKAIEATKEATDKSVQATKDFTNKAVKATKKGYRKTVDATKDFTDKTVENTKSAIENMNPNKPVTREELEGKARIKTLKNERKELKAAYNSRIKDIEAKVKSTTKATNISDVERQNKIYTLNKEKAALELQRDAAIEKYNKRIKNLKELNKKES
jgi:hypothetical protein